MIDRSLTAADMGRVIVTFRSWPSTSAAVVTGALVVGLLVVIAIMGGSSTDVSIRAGLVGMGVLWLSPFFISGALDKHRVCERGLVVGFRKNSRYVIPWSSVDPGRVRVLRRSWWFGAYAGHPTRMQCNRSSHFTPQAVVLNGWDSSLRTTTAPFTWWVLGVRRPESLARAIEEAMVADGFPAHGLADRAVRQAIVPGLRKAVGPVLPHRNWSDPELGVDGPLMTP